MTGAPKPRTQSLFRLDPEDWGLSATPRLEVEAWSSQPQSQTQASTSQLNNSESTTSSSRSRADSRYAKQEDSLQFSSRSRRRDSRSLSPDRRSGDNSSSTPRRRSRSPPPPTPVLSVVPSRYINQCRTKQRQVDPERDLRNVVGDITRAEPLDRDWNWKCWENQLLFLENVSIIFE